MIKIVLSEHAGGGRGDLRHPIREANQMWERVHARSLLEEVPVILQRFIEQMFAKV